MITAEALCEPGGHPPLSAELAVSSWRPVEKGPDALIRCAARLVDVHMPDPMLGLDHDVTLRAPITLTRLRSDLERLLRAQNVPEGEIQERMQPFFEAERSAFQRLSERAQQIAHRSGRRLVVPPDWDDELCHANSTREPR